MATNEMQPANLNEMTFRQAMASLDTVVSSLESNTLELEDSLSSYEQGVALLCNLRARLDAAQQKVDVLMGEFEVADSDEVVDSTLHKA